MKRIILLLILVGLIAGGVFGYPKIQEELKKRKKVTFETVKVTRGDVIYEVLTTGTVEPVLKIDIGSFVSGPIVELFVDFNEVVEKDQLLAKVDPQLFQAALVRDEASLETAKARVLQTRTELQRAKNDENRARNLREIDEDYLSDTEMDQLKFARQSLEAQLLVSEQSVRQAAAQMNNSKINLDYTEIKAPASGTIIDRKIDEGQTLAAQFNTPSLFTLAPDMEKTMWVLASVQEADIGMVIEAQKDERPVFFTVTSYEEDLFEGRIHQIRKNPTTESSVVTYVVVVETPNPGGKLLPGMTADLSFEVSKREDVLRIPDAAIRYVPEKSEHVREEDKKIIERLNEGKGDEDEEEEQEILSAAMSRVAAIKKRRKRHVWVVENEKLKAVEIEFGIDSGGYYELVKGDLEEGTELVTGISSKQGK